jgi:hypothetical protein
MRLKGATIRDIAAELDVSVATVLADLRHVERDWRERAVADYDMLVAEQMARLDAVLCAAWDAFYKSQQPQTRQTRVVDPVFGRVRRIMVQEVERTGDPRHLQVVCRAIEARCKLLGLYSHSPHRTPSEADAAAVPCKPPESYPDDPEARELAHQLLKRIATADASLPPPA